MGQLNSTRLASLCAENLGWSKSTTYTVLRKVKQKGAGGGAGVESGGMVPFLTTFMSGRRLTKQEAEALKRLIDEKMGES